MPLFVTFNDSSLSLQFFNVTSLLLHSIIVIIIFYISSDSELDYFFSNSHPSFEHFFAIFHFVFASLFLSFTASHGIFGLLVHIFYISMEEKI